MQYFDFDWTHGLVPSVGEPGDCAAGLFCSSALNVHHSFFVCQRMFVSFVSEVNASVFHEVIVFFE